MRDKSNMAYLGYRASRYRPLKQYDVCPFNQSQCHPKKTVHRPIRWVAVGIRNICNDELHLQNCYHY